MIELITAGLLVAIVVVLTLFVFLLFSPKL
jgi:hypothetical protein